MTAEQRALAERIANRTVAPGSLALVWLGQAGFLVKTPAGTTVMIDPYFSDYGEEMWGLRRVVPPPLDHAEFAPDLLLVTHWHEDHLDKPVVTAWGRRGGTTLVAPLGCTARAAAWGWPADRLVTVACGETVAHADVSLTATFVRHEAPTAEVPDAVGFLLRAAGLTVWNVGDTEYDARMRPLRAARPDVMIVPINGVGGNLDADEAALLVWKVQPRTVIPAHFDLWAPEGFGPGATLDPVAFAAILDRLGGGPAVHIPQRGEIVTFTAG